MNHHEKDQPGISPWRLLALAAIGVCAIVFFQFLASPELKITHCSSDWLAQS
jgi:hypothetical protein